MNRHNLSTSNFEGKKGAFIVLAKFIVFWALLLLFFFIKVSPQYLYSYNASLLDKVERVESINEPKIVLIGNSNVAFGIRSELIEKEFGMPVVNMGLHEGLGNSFNEKMAKLNVNEGDIIIICHSNFANDTFSESKASLAWITVENHIELWKMLRWKDVPMMIKTFPTYMKKAINLYLHKEGNTPIDYPYDRMAFNQYGDNIYSETHEEQYEFSEKFVSKVPSISDECVERINALNKYILERGGTLLIAGYPIAYGEIYPDVKAFDAFKDELSTKLKCKVISDYENYFFEYQYFYNTIFHLTNEGAILRTNQLIEDLREYLDSKEEHRENIYVYALN